MFTISAVLKDAMYDLSHQRIHGFLKFAIITYIPPVKRLLLLSSHLCVLVKKGKNKSCCELEAEIPIYAFLILHTTELAAKKDILPSRNFSWLLMGNDAANIG